eukprot:scaffold8596_cov128-Isochrysis_galbana.AAC.5
MLHIDSAGDGSRTAQWVACGMYMLNAGVSDACRTKHQPISLLNGERIYEGGCCETATTAPNIMA